MRLSALTILTLASLFASKIVLAQGTTTNSMIDTVVISAPDPSASETGPDPGRFEIRRTGPTNYSLAVFYRIGGTASNGVDYETINESVVIDAGKYAAGVDIKPIDDSLVEGPETVILQIIPSPLLCPGPNCGYYIGSPSNAVVYIADNDRNPTNKPGEVNIVATDPFASEVSNATAGALDTATFTVRRSDGTNESIVVYYEISGTASNGVDYQKLSGQVTLGEGVFSADIVVVPIDDNLAEGTETVTLTLIAPCPACLWANPPCDVVVGTNCYPIGAHNQATAYIRDNEPTNAPPGIAITSPQDSAVFRPPATIEIHAEALDRDGYVPLVEFFANDKKIGEEQISFFQQPPPGQTEQFTFVWSNVLAGDYVLTARATDDQGATGLSRPVRILVTESNRPPETNVVVGIFASDPIAVEGQFCSSNWWWTTSGSTAVGWETNSTTTRSNYCTGTNNATFVVHRNDGTNSDLTVYYAIGGTASNGVDYLTLPGQVTIPAGHRAARIEVVPIDDNIVEGIETVLLTLQPSPTDASAYQIGPARRAAAIILDNDSPRPPCAVLRDGMFHLCSPGTNGYTYCVRASADLINWTAVCTNIVTEGAVHFVDPDATDLRNRFYFVVPDSNYTPPQ